MQVIINTEIYKKRNNMTHKAIAEAINAKYDLNYSRSAITKGLNGINRSYKLHYLICEVLKIDFEEIYKCQ